MMLDFEAGVAVGQALSQLKDHESRISKIEADVEVVKALGIRAALLLLLWGGAVAANLPADRVGAFMASFLQGLSK
jgi:hypothetical protein